MLTAVESRGGTLSTEDQDDVDPDSSPVSKPDRFRLRVCIVQLVGFATVFALLIRMMPKLEKTYKEFDVLLPLPSQFAISASIWFGSYWFVAAAGWILGTLGILVVDQVAGRAAARLLNRTAIVGTVVLTIVIVIGALLPLIEVMQHVR